MTRIGGRSASWLWTTLLWGAVSVLSLLSIHGNGVPHKAAAAAAAATASNTESIRHNRSRNLRHGKRRLRKLQVRQFVLWSPEQIHDTLLQWQSTYPNLVRVKTAQQAYGLPTAGEESDCPYDSGIGCLNYILTIQDYLVHAEGSTSSNALPEVLLSGELHGNERVGPTAVMETALLLLEASSCEASFEYDPLGHASCSATLQAEHGVTKRQRQWLARLVATRRIVIVPTANALGYYQDTRAEGGIDVNRDFPFDYEDPSMCMRTIGGRTLNEVFREHLFQMALTFHGGIELVGYEWGADSFIGSLSPDDEAQEQIARAYSSFGGGWSGTDPYPFGPMDRIIYTVKGGMEDWAYAGSWLPDKVVPCQPTTFGGYSTDRTVYSDGMLRAFNMLIETSETKTPITSSLGTTQDLLSKDTSGNGHVSRNVRLSLLATDLVEPYLSFVGVDGLALSTDIVPLSNRICQRMNAVKVPQSLNQVTVEWTVGGAFTIDNTQLYYGRWNSVLGAMDCMSQPNSAVESTLTPALPQTTTGTGYFTSGGASPSTFSATGDSPLGPVFRTTIDLSLYGVGEEVVVMVKARVDQSWLQQPSGISPQVPPQSHMVKARTDPSWYHTNNGKVVQGRLDWYSVVPLTLIISDTADLQEVSSTVEGSETANESSPTPEPTWASTPPPSTKAPTIPVTPAPVTRAPATSAPTAVPPTTPPPTESTAAPLFLPPLSSMSPDPTSSPISSPTVVAPLSLPIDADAPVATPVAMLSSSPMSPPVSPTLVPTPNTSTPAVPSPVPTTASPPTTNSPVLDLPQQSPTPTWSLTSTAAASSLPSPPPTTIGGDDKGDDTASEASEAVLFQPTSSGTLCRAHVSFLWTVSIVAASLIVYSLW